MLRSCCFAASYREPAASPGVSASCLGCMSLLNHLQNCAGGARGYTVHFPPPAAAPVMAPLTCYPQSCWFYTWSGSIPAACCLPVAYSQCMCKRSPETTMVGCGCGFPATLCDQTGLGEGGHPAWGNGASLVASS